MHTKVLHICIMLEHDDTILKNQQLVNRLTIYSLVTATIDEMLSQQQRT